MGVVIVGFLSLALFHSYLASFSRKLWDVCEQSGLFPRAKPLEHLLLAKRAGSSLSDFERTVPARCLSKSSNERGNYSDIFS